MSNLATTNGSAIASWDSSQVEIIKNQIAKGCSDGELQLFGQVCQKTGLDPFSRQIYAIVRNQYNPDTRQKEPKMTIQLSIDGFRTVAARSGLYGGSTTEWCGDDGIWRDVWLSTKPPAAAKTTVYRKGSAHPFTGVARFESYAPIYNGKVSGLWEKMPDVLIGKCFSKETQVLTTNGFEYFHEVTGKILQVTESGMKATDSIPFVQPYFGKMIELRGDMLNFSVTPNHDMVTTFGKVEARAMMATAKTTKGWRIPLLVPGSVFDADVSDRVLELVGAVLADGAFNGHQKWIVAVSRPHKVEKLRELDPVVERVQRSSGGVARTATRDIVTNFDKRVFTYEVADLASFINTDKTIKMSSLMELSQKQAKVLLDSWIKFDGSVNKKTGKVLIFTSREDHVKAIELLAVLAGYSVGVPKPRNSDIGTKPNYVISISKIESVPIRRNHPGHPSIQYADNTSNEVWCVTVPSGQIVVRLDGFSMVCGNCSESLALRKAFPAELSGLYSSEEMEQADDTPIPTKIDTPQPKAIAPYSEDIKLRQQALRECCEILEWTPEYKAEWVKTISPRPLSTWRIEDWDLAVVKALAAIDQLNSDEPVLAEVV